VNTAYNNLSLTPNPGHRGRVATTIHTHNAGYTGRWDPGGGEGNFDTHDLDPRVMSMDPASPDFMRLASDSPYRTAGKVITGGSTTIGAVPDGQRFANNWDWRAMVAPFPSHGLKARSPQYPIPQT